jgi:hypothetical protein
MFAKKATFRAIDRARSIARAGLVHSNDNHVTRMAGAPHAPALVCHWRIAAATGKPECHWEASPSCRRDAVTSESDDGLALIRLDEVCPSRRGRIS